MEFEETIEERQKNELVALKSIYLNDIREVQGKKCWNLWQPLDVIISLSPQKGSSTPKEIHASVDLHVICSEDYPNVVPKLQLENAKGMSNSVLNELQKDLEEIAESMVGEVMIFELTQYVQTFLHRHNKPASKSFYDEMLKRQEEREREMQLAKQMEREREREGILNEYQMKQEILRQENKRKRERYSSEYSNEERSPETRCSSGLEDLPCTCKGTELIEFTNNIVQEIQRGKCIHHSSQNCVIYSGIDVDTGEFYIITEWMIPYKNEDFHILKQVNSIEQEFNYLVKLKHANLAWYLNMKHSIYENENKIVVHILREFVIGVNCTSLFINQNIPVDLDMLRHITSGVLGAIDFLHRNNVVHKEITPSNIYICKNGIVKLVNHSLNKRLSDLVRQNQVPSSINKKTDILKFGISILSLFKGQLLSEEQSAIPTSVSSDFHDFISKCLVKEEKERYTATQLLNHPFVRIRLEKFSPKHNYDGTPFANELPSSELKLLNNSSSGPSRIETEFEVLQFIGKGAFGDVIKVKNKLDGGYYAIKKIELNPKSKQLNRKITREVKLLSKLNHENVVRYYNAWIESAILENEGSETSTLNSIETVSNVPKLVKPKELTIKNDIELLAPPLKNVEWSIYDSKSHANRRDMSSSDEDSSDEDENWGLMINVDSSDSESIKFEGSNDNEKSEETTNEKTSSEKASNVHSSQQQQYFREIQFLYIQMEFCEKSTLRIAIDAELYLDMDRVWRLFREIVEGLAHIHQQGMIHRDLKPVNIFLDSNDHVKIGDFGLATNNLFCRQDFTSGSRSLIDSEKVGTSIEDGSLTGQVGTALYAAPELNTTTKTVYNQKVDIYSLGIIFFEMCYRPLQTQMERTRVLSSLRTEEIIFPSDFKRKSYTKQEYIIKWLLSHDISKRPTSQELLQSNLIPAAVLEEEKLRDMFQHTLNNPQLKSYKFLIASCFQQPVTPAQDLTYDMDLPDVVSTKSLQLYELVRETVTKIFKLHGGKKINTPLLIPKSKYYDNVESCVKLMTHAGGIVSLPHDLRVPFARYVAWNGITLLRRYSIDRVYREKKVFGFHPRELYECAFDIVTPTSENLMADAEVLYIVCEILEELPGLKNKNFVIHLNHTSLLKAILLHCGIKDKHHEIYRILSDAKEGKAKQSQVKTHLISLGLPDSSIATLCSLIDLELPLSKITCNLQSITKKKSSGASVLAKQALQDLKTIVNNVERLGVSYSILITPGLTYNIEQYSGMMCRFMGEFKKRKRRGYEVLVGGGRYDDMIAEYRNIKEQANMSVKDIKQSAVGISISLERLVQAVQEELEKDTDVSYLDAVICSLGSKDFVKEKAQIMKDLSAAGVRTTIIEGTNVEDVQEKCTELNVSIVIILKEKGEVRLRISEKGRFQEKIISTSEVVDTVQRSIRNSYEGSTEQQIVPIARSESKISNYDHCHDVSVTVDFVTTEKLSSNTRRRLENQIRSQLDNTFKRFNGDLVVLAVNLDSILVKALSSYLEFESEKIFQKSVDAVVEKHQRNRRYISEVAEEIYDYKVKNVNVIIILYSLNDQFYKVIF